MGHQSRTRVGPAVAKTRWRAFGWAVAGALLTVLVVGCGGADGPRGAAETQDTSTTAPTVAPSTLVDEHPPLVIAHRGASAYAPEHTFASYDLARAQGADYLEQDLQLTADGELVVLHDPVLDRTARGPAASCSGLVADKTLAQLEECDVGSWFNEAHPELADPSYVGQRIPTMEQVLDRYGSDVRYYIELKATDAGSGMEAPLIELLARAGMLTSGDADRPVIVQSFGAEVLRTVHELEPGLPLVLLLRDAEAVDGTALDAVREYAFAVGPPSGVVDEAFVTIAHERCLEVHPYTVDDPAEMTRLIDARVDGMFTNAPATLRAVVAGSPALPRPCSVPPSG